MIHALCIHYQGLLYAVGGHDGNKHLNTGEAFDPNASSWRDIAAMTTPRYIITQYNYVMVFYLSNICVFWFFLLSIIGLDSSKIFCYAGMILVG